MRKMKKCSVCGEMYAGKSKYCSQKCYAQHKSFSSEQAWNTKTKDTLCWECKKATGCGDCPWANRFEPVDGWDATPTEIKTVGRIEQSYIVNDCPLFERDKR